MPSKQELHKLPSIADCEAALGLKAEEWKGRCHAVATFLVDEGLVTGEPRYGLYHGKVSICSFFSATAPFHRHGWIERPGGFIVVDPTRWVFEARKPYIFQGLYSSDYDPGAQRLAEMRVRPYPGSLPGETTFGLALSDDAARHLSAMTGQHTDFNFDQIFWLANLPVHLLGGYSAEVYRALDAIGQRALIPIDNFRMATSPWGPPPHLLGDTHPRKAVEVIETKVQRGNIPGLEDLFLAADAHAAEAGDCDYAVGDLQEILRAAWRIMTPAQVANLFVQPELVALAELPEYQPLIGHLACRPGEVPVPED